MSIALSSSTISERLAFEEFIIKKIWQQAKFIYIQRVLPHINQNPRVLLSAFQKSGLYSSAASI